MSGVTPSRPRRRSRIVFGTGLISLSILESWLASISPSDSFSPITPDSSRTRFRNTPNSCSDCSGSFNTFFRFLIIRIFPLSITYPSLIHHEKRFICKTPHTAARRRDPPPRQNSSPTAGPPSQVHTFFYNAAGFLP